MKEPKMTYNFKQTLSYEEQERFSYVSGDTTSADMFDKLTELEDMEDQLKEARDNTWSAESAVDDIKVELERYKEVTEALKEIFYALPLTAQKILCKLDD